MTDIQELRRHERDCAINNPFAGPEGGGGECDCALPGLLDEVERLRGELEAANQHVKILQEQVDCLLP